MHLRHKRRSSVSPKKTANGKLFFASLLNTYIIVQYKKKLGKNIKKIPKHFNNTMVKNSQNELLVDVK